MADNKIFSLEHAKLLAMRCYAAMNSKIAELTDVFGNELITLDEKVAKVENTTNEEIAHLDEAFQQSIDDISSAVAQKATVQFIAWEADD